ncbi:MAG: ABC transporter ATP-binding protein [Candidatus Aminicenantes bacterium]|nr:ABC transporter ATP-binding protein [Candidatus Aminicenantes bacterium]
MSKHVTIKLEDVSYSYPGTKAGVSDIDLTIREGELLAVIGASGCGKSTLLKLIAGFLTPNRGNIQINGVDMAGVPPRQRNLGVVFQNYSLFPHMTAWLNVAYPLKVRKIRSQERREEALGALQRVGLEAFTERHPTELSGGQQQRVALARALVFRPCALLLDEPLSALDAALRPRMRDEIRRLQRQYGIAALHITHDQEEALSMADRVAVMETGRLVQVATPHGLYDSPATRSVAAFVGHANLWDGKAAGPDTVLTPLGLLHTQPHGQLVDTPLTVMVRPEWVRLGPSSDGQNTFTGRVALDRFLGPIRRFDLAVEGGVLVGETADRGPITTVHFQGSQVQVLSQPAPAPAASRDAQLKQGGVS